MLQKIIWKPHATFKKRKPKLGRILEFASELRSCQTVSLNEATIFGFIAGADTKTNQGLFHMAVYGKMHFPAEFSSCRQLGSVLWIALLFIKR